MPIFSSEELIRYSKHLNITRIGENGQKKLKHSSVLCVGAGGIGGPALLYLASQGIGKIGIIDNDDVSLSNLHRQILFSTEQCAQRKTDCSKKQLLSLNPNINVHLYHENLHVKNAENILSSYDIILDGTDNYESRYLINDVSHYLKKPLVAASVFQFSGQIGLFNYNGGPCYRCLYPEKPDAGLIPNCSEAGVLGVIPGILGTMAALEVVKVILNIGDTLTGKLGVFNGLDMSLKLYTFHPSKECVLCHGTHHYDNLNLKENVNYISADEIDDTLQYDNEEIMLIDVRSKKEHDFYHLPNSILYPLPDMLNSKQLSLPCRGLKTIIYCEKGNRSKEAVQFLQKHGYNNVYSLEGGIEAYKKACSNK